MHEGSAAPSQARLDHPGLQTCTPTQLKPCSHTLCSTRYLGSLVLHAAALMEPKGSRDVPHSQGISLLLQQGVASHCALEPGLHHGQHADGGHHGQPVLRHLVLHVDTRVRLAGTAAGTAVARHRGAGLPHTPRQDCAAGKGAYRRHRYVRILQTVPWRQCALCMEDCTAIWMVGGPT